MLVHLLQVSKCPVLFNLSVIIAHYLEDYISL